MGDRRHIRFQTPTAVNPSWNRAPSHVHPQYSRPHPVVHQPISIPMRTNRAASVTSVTPPLITITGNLIFTNMPEDGVAVLGPVCPPPSTSPPRYHRSSRPAPPHVIYQRQQRTTQHSLPARVPYSQPSMPSRPQRSRITLNPPHRFFYEQQEQVAVTDEFLWASPNGSHYMYSNVEAARVSMPSTPLPALLPHISRIVTNYTASLPAYPSTPTPRGRSYVSEFPSRSNESHVDAPRGGVHSYLEEGASYEALLELGEQLGTVRLLSEEDISAHLNVEAASSSMESDMCVVCQDTIELEQAIAVLQCKHSYHADCIKRWLLEKNVCPVCKRTGIVV